jgi:hypothetical protein
MRKLRYFGSTEVYDFIVPEETRVEHLDDVIGQRFKPLGETLVIPWRGKNLRLSASLIPLLATQGFLGLKLIGVTRLTEVISPGQTVGET